MAILFDTAKQIELLLADRGLTKAAVKQGMNILFGDDWEGMSQEELFQRLAAKHYTVSNDLPAFADEMEGLVRGAVAMDELRRTLKYGMNDRGW